MSKDPSKTIFVSDFNSIQDHVDWICNNRVNRHNSREFPSKLVKLDFRYSKFLKPYHIAPLACLIHEYKQKGFTMRITNPSTELRNYFESFNFDQFCKVQEKSSFPISKDPKTLPLWCIDQAAANLYPALAQQYFENNHFDGKSLFALSSSLAELMNNVFDHSGSSIPGYTFSQYNTRNHQIVTCVCDFGIGIPRKVNEFLVDSGKNKLSNIEALTQALQQKFSTLSKPHNRGNGWDNILSCIAGIAEKLLIISNNVVYVLMSAGNVKTNLLTSNFPGTAIVIYLDANVLPQKEEEMTDELIIL